MQDYIDFAAKNGVTLIGKGACQFCGAQTTGGIHECLEIFNLGFQSIDFNDPANHRYRFFIVDAHALQHPEIHGRWSNHFHLTRLHLIFKHGINWSYSLSPKLSDCLNSYKSGRKEEFFTPPEVLKRGRITSTDVLKLSEDAAKCKTMIRNWAIEVYETWNNSFQIVDQIAKAFLKENSTPFH